ncbi:MAG: hypothetical protein ABIJ75_05190, partial [Actinomycetota bacterium]
MRNIAQSSTALGQGKLFTRFLDTVGDGTGLTNAASEYGIDLGDATFDFTGGAAEDLWTLAAHGLVEGEMVYFDAVGTGDTGCVVDTNYFVIYIGANTFQLATTYANAIAAVAVPIEGTADSAGAWSLTKQVGWFKIDPSELEVMVVTSLAFHLYDTNGGLPDEFGDIGAVLTNGIALDLLDVDGNSIIDLFDGNPVTMGADFEMFCTAAPLVAGTTNQSYVYRMNIPERYGQELRVVGAPGEFNSYLQMTVNDDTSGLLSFYVVAQGYYESGQL